jgi:hypothetical protein
VTAEKTMNQKLDFDSGVTFISGKKNSYIDSFNSLADYNIPLLNELHIKLYITLE